jgi:hypothetical protein
MIVGDENTKLCAGLFHGGSSGDHQCVDVLSTNDAIIRADTAKY